MPDDQHLEGAAGASPRSHIGRTGTLEAAHPDATSQLWAEFSDRLRAFIASRVSSPDAVDDILQDVFLKIHRRGDTLRDSTRLSSWVFQVTRNAVIDHYRSAPRRREVVVADVGEDVTAHEEEPLPTPAARREIAACLRPLLQRLPGPYREALEMVELEGLTQVEAATHAGVSVSGMKSRVQRGRAQLHRTLHSWCDIEVDARGGPLRCDPGTDTACDPGGQGTAPGQGCA